MANKSPQAIRGMHDILPDGSGKWQRAEAIMQKVLASYDYHEIRLPILEKTELFQRSIGEATDIVAKEMYTFADRNESSLTMRPEGTAGCLRAALEHGLLHNQTQKLWYYGPMFRYERPQKGRYRQFYQLGVEAYGMAGSAIEAELIALGQRLWKNFAIEGKLTLQLNSLGTMGERAKYRQKLQSYLQNYRNDLDADSQQRLETNPLRILDSKNPATQEILQNAPLLQDHLGQESKQYQQQLLQTLRELGIDYVLNGRLVRGLDYYCQTVFEWTTDELGAQSAVCAGGRYDGLVQQLGGKENYAVGFALGMERLLMLCDATPSPSIDGYIICTGGKAQQAGLQLAEQLRERDADIKLQVNCLDASIKSQFKKADKSGAKYALILGEDELARGEVGYKPLRVRREQINIARNRLGEYLAQGVQGST